MGTRRLAPSCSITMETLPNTIFFDPKPSFITWLAGKHKFIVDVGCGVARLGAKLLEKQCSVLSIDIIERDEPESKVVIHDSTTFQYPKGALVIITRPCRGNWIIGTIERAISCGCKVVYVGISEHYEEDIEPLKDKFCVKHIMSNAGEDGEDFYMITSNEENEENEEANLKTWRLVDWGVGYYWLEDRGNENWYHSNGISYFSKIPKRDKIKETVKAEYYDDLDHTKTDLLRPDSNMGWLDRYGKFYGCGYMEHDTVAYLILHKEIKELEKQGWVRVDGDGEYRYSASIDMSAEQKNWLSLKGCAIDK